MNFKEYESKPIKRMAHQILAPDVIQELKEPNMTRVVCEDSSWIDFQSYEEVKFGSYIIFLNESDIYHCNEEVFKKRNIV